MKEGLGEQSRHKGEWLIMAHSTCQTTVTVPNNNTYCIDLKLSFFRGSHLYTAVLCILGKETYVQYCTVILFAWLQNHYMWDRRHLAKKTKPRGCCRGACVSIYEGTCHDYDLFQSTQCKTTKGLQTAPAVQIFLKVLCNNKRGSLSSTFQSFSHESLRVHQCIYSLCFYIILV